MKKSIAKWLTTVIVTVMLLLLTMDYVIEINSAREHMVQDATKVIAQLKELVEQENEED